MKLFGTTIALIEHDMGVVMEPERPRRRDGLTARRCGDGTPSEVRNNQDVIARVPGGLPMTDFGQMFCDERGSDMPEATWPFSNRGVPERSDGGRAVCIGRVGVCSNLTSLRLFSTMAQGVMAAR